MKKVQLDCIYLFLLLMFIISEKGSSHGIYIRDSEDNVTITVGAPHQVTLTCEVRNEEFQTYEMRWYRGTPVNRRIVVANGIAYLSRMYAWQDISGINITHHLTIDPVHGEDQDNYWCELKNDNAIQQHQRNFWLEVKVRPSITAKEEVEVVEGHEAKLRCKAEGQPQPEVMWGREDGEMINVLKEVNGTFTKVEEIQYFGEELRLGNTTTKDAGTYLCIAKNMVPPAATFSVNLKVLRVSIDDSESPQKISYFKGQHKTLTCVVNNVGNYTVSWIRADNSTTLTSNDDMVTTDFRMTLSRPNEISWNLEIYLMRREDAGKYICEVNRKPAIFKEYILRMY